MKETKLIQLAKRKIQARQYARIDEGKLKVRTPQGYRKVEDGDWLLPMGNDIWVLLPRDTMDYLIAQEKEDSPTPAVKKGAKAP